MKIFFKKISDLAKKIKENWHDILTFCIGLTFIILVCTGVFMLGKGIFRGFFPSKIYANNVEPSMIHAGLLYDPENGDGDVEIGSKEYYENVVSNFVRLDFEEFDDANNIDDKYLISYGIWQGISLNNSQGIYNFDSKGSFKIPKKDVEKYLNYSFDYNGKIKHKTVDLCKTFKYNSMNKCYTVTSSGIPSYMVPKVVEIEEKDKTVVLTVDCYMQTDYEQGDATENEQNFQKRVEITLKIVDDKEITQYQNSSVPHYMFASMKEIKK